jgi:hypothetical protein
MKQTRTEPEEDKDRTEVKSTCRFILGRALFPDVCIKHAQATSCVTVTCVHLLEAHLLEAHLLAIEARGIAVELVVFKSSTRRTLLRNGTYHA